MSLVRSICCVALLMGVNAVVPAAPTARAAELSVSIGGASSSGAVMPGKSEVIQLIHMALVSLDHANRTGNYTVFRQMASPHFQDANSVEQLGAVFKAWRLAGINLSAIALREPLFQRPPGIDPQGLLNLVGVLPGPPDQVKFSLSFMQVDNEWQLYALSLVTAGPATANARKRLDGKSKALMPNLLPGADAG